MTALVVDASVLVAAVAGRTDDGPWARVMLRRGRLAAPAHALVEAANGLRGLAARATLDAESAAQAHEDVLAVPVDLFPYRLLAPRAWELGGAITILDGAYVALAEALGVPLATCDRRLARAPGPVCEILVP